MKSVLVAYATKEGQARRVAEFIADALRLHDVEVEVVDTAAPRAAQVQPIYAAAILCGSLQHDRFPHAFEHFVRDNKYWLAGLPAAVVAVCPDATDPGADGRARLRRATEAFYRDAGWTPGITHPAAGALPHSAYQRFRSLLPTRAAAAVGGDDAAHDHAHIDTVDLTRFVEEFLAAITLPEDER
jgi:menaquinone-dependent protoporphyrinogen IX oxidase